eukprot:gene13177-14461_t
MTSSSGLSTTLYASIERHIDIPQYEDEEDNEFDPEETQIEEKNHHEISPFTMEEDTRMSAVINIDTPWLERLKPPEVADEPEVVVPLPGDDSETIGPSQETQFPSSDDENSPLPLKKETSITSINRVESKETDMKRLGSLILIDEDDFNGESEIQFFKTYQPSTKFQTPTPPTKQQPMEEVLPPTVPLLIDTENPINRREAPIYAMETCALDLTDIPSSTSPPVIPISRSKTSLARIEQNDDDTQLDEEILKTAEQNKLKRSNTSISNFSSSASLTMNKKQKSNLGNESDDWMANNQSLPKKHRRLKQLTLLPANKH